MAIGGKIKWNGGKIRRKIDREMETRMQAIGERVASHARRKMSTATRAQGPSAPGDKYPHADTGTLRKSVMSRVDKRGGKITASVGTKVEYAEFVHEGTSRMGEGRPFLISAIEENRSAIQRILSRPL